MRSKAPLALMEQMVMLLVFALASALCLQAFVKSDAISAGSEAQDKASLVVQSAAEVIRHEGGDMSNALSGAAKLLGGSYEQGMLWIDYDENWAVTGERPGEENYTYRLTAQGVPAEVPGLWKALVRVISQDSAESETLFEVEVAWQEVSASG